MNDTTENETKRDSSKSALSNLVMPPFTFKWKETITKTLDIPASEMVGVQPWYEPTDTQGEVVIKGGRLCVEWEDGVEDTYLDTKRGLEILKDCKPF